MILVEHLRAMTRGLRRISPEHWDWTYSVSAPTMRMIALHTLAWLQCDRQHLTIAEHKLHRLVPEPPSSPKEICDALWAEADKWETLLNSLSAEDLNREGCQFGDPEAKMTGRGFVVHMVQNVIYKHGQFATIFYALGYDGTGPYEAPFPNDLYLQNGLKC